MQLTSQYGEKSRASHHSLLDLPATAICYLQKTDFKSKTMPLLHTLELRTDLSVHTGGLQGKPPAGRPLRPAAAMEICQYSHGKNPVLQVLSSPPRCSYSIPVTPD